MTVHCDAGFSLVGDDVITCIKDDNYRSIHGHLPSCKESEFVKIDKFYLLSNAIIITIKYILQFCERGHARQKQGFDHSA